MEGQGYQNQNIAIWGRILNLEFFGKIDRQ